MNREGRPSGPNRPAPQLNGWRLRPVGVDPYTPDDSVAIHSTKARPLHRRFRDRRRRGQRRRLLLRFRIRALVGGNRCSTCRLRRGPLMPALGLDWLRGRLECRSRRDRNWFVSGFGKEAFLRRLRPSPHEIRRSGAGDSAGPQQAEHARCQQDRDYHRRATKPIGKTASRHRPRDEGHCLNRDTEDDEHHAHHPVGDRFVNDAGRRNECDDHQCDRAQPLGPGGRG